MLYRLVYSVLQFLKRHPNFIRLSVLAVVVLAIASIVSTKIYQHWDNDPDRGAIGIERHTYDEGSSTPQYLKEKYSTPQYLDQGWSAADSLWFYTTTQGSALLPYDFFLVLERADSAELFKSDQNIDRFRYLPQKKTFFNPDALPVGFVKTTYDGKDYVGFTCAACHTAQINYKDPAPGSDDKPAEALRIDGGPAMADMVGFLTELRKAVQAAQSGDKQNKDTSWLHPYSWFNALAAWASGQKDKKEVIEFKSSINLFNLQRLESSLRSLKSPQWPFCRNAKGEYYLPADKKDPTSPVDKRPCFGKDEKINKAWSKNGESIYLKHCVHCHTLVDREDWDRVVVGNVTKLSKIGTDQAMAWNSVNYMGWSGNFKDTYQETSVGDVVVEEHAPVLQILTAATRGVVATPDHGKGYIRRFVEWIYIIVATIGDNTIKKKSVKKGNYDPDTTSRPYDSLLAYRARSLNGIWATAPYLHNGSVPTLYDLLLPASQRPSSFQVGGREFDPDKVGFKSKGLDFTTDEPGNKNTGHLYGTGMSDDERRDLLEYLKSL